MTDNPSKRSGGLTPAKAILICVLGVILVAVIVIQLPSTSSKSSLKRPNPDKRHDQTNGLVRPVSRQTLDVSKELLVPANEKAWPKFSLQLVQSHDPFVTPPWYPGSDKFDTTANDGSSEVTSEETPGQASEADREMLAELQTHGVSMVMITDDDRLAMVGQVELRVGDRIGGFLVKEITTDGVTLVEHDALGSAAENSLGHEPHAAVTAWSRLGSRCVDDSRTLVLKFIRAVQRYHPSGEPVPALSNRPSAPSSDGQSDNPVATLPSTSP